MSLARCQSGQPGITDPKVIDALLSIKLSRSLSTTISLEDLENDRTLAVVQVDCQVAQASGAAENAGVPAVAVSAGYGA
jgi:hypothetical protein